MPDTSREAVERLADYLEGPHCSRPYEIEAAATLRSLLARTEAAEARVKELEGALRNMVPPELKWREQGTTCLITHPTEVIRAARAALNTGDDNG